MKDPISERTLGVTLIMKDPIGRERTLGVILIMKDPIGGRGHFNYERSYWGERTLGVTLIMKDPIIIKLDFCKVRMILITGHPSIE